MHKLDAYRCNNATHTCKKHNHFYLLSLRRRYKHHAQSDSVCDQLDQVKGNRDELVQCCVGLLTDDEESVQQLMESPYGIVFPLKQVSPDFVWARLVVARQQGTGLQLRHALGLEQVLEQHHHHQVGQQLGQLQG